MRKKEPVASRRERDWRKGWPVLFWVDATRWFPFSRSPRSPLVVVSSPGRSFAPFPSASKSTLSPDLPTAPSPPTNQIPPPAEPFLFSSRAGERKHECGFR